MPGTYVRWCTLIQAHSAEQQIVSISSIVLPSAEDYIDSKYNESMVKLSKFKCFAEISFLAFLDLHRERKRCGQVGFNTC